MVFLTITFKDISCYNVESLEKNFFRSYIGDVSITMYQQGSVLSPLFF